MIKINTNSPALPKNKAELFHTFVAKDLFHSKRARQEIQPAIAFLATRIKNPTESDWNKMKKVMGFLQDTKDEVMTLEMGDNKSIEWYVDASFAVHQDCRSHTGAVMTLGKGSVQSISTKQKISTRSSTEAELVY